MALWTGGLDLALGGWRLRRGLDHFHRGRGVLGSNGGQKPVVLRLVGGKRGGIGESAMR